MLAVSSTPCQTKKNECLTLDFHQTKQYRKGTKYQTKPTRIKDVFYKDSYIYSDFISCNCKILLYYRFVVIRTDI